MYNLQDDEILQQKSGPERPDIRLIGQGETIDPFLTNKYHIFCMEQWVFRVLADADWNLGSITSAWCWVRVLNRINRIRYNNQFEKQMEKPLSYNKISIQKRKQLVDLVTLENYSIAKASKALQIKNSTAKLIVKRFRDTGTFFQRKRQRYLDLSGQERVSHSSPPAPTDNIQASEQITVTAQPNQLPFLFYFYLNVQMPNAMGFQWQPHFPIISEPYYIF